MKPTFPVLAALLAAGAAAPASAPARARSIDAPLPIDPEWSASRLWDDGQAEVARYDAKRTIYGKPRAYELAAVTVKEEFDPAQRVKSDRAEPPASLTVMKLNLVQRIETENYPYNFLTSVFVERADPRRFVKETHGSQEWCGNSFQELVADGGALELRYHSYWDGEGDGTRRFERPADGVLEDALFLVLRAAKLEAGKAYPVKLFPSRISSKVGDPKWRPATIAEVGEEAVSVEGAPIEAVRVEVRHEGGRVDSYWIEKAFPRSVVRFDQAGLDGRSGILKNRARYAYWR